jgi:hypothetical protein
MSMGLLLVALIAFSGFASAATISNTGSNVHYITSTDKWINHWYITTANTSSSTFVFKGKNQKHTSGGWNTIGTFSLTFNFLKVSKTSIKMTEKAYSSGKLIFSKSNTFKTTLTPLKNAKSIESIEIKTLKIAL